MDFNGQYLTYEEYLGLGGTLDQMPFNILEFEARKLIDQRTFNRLKNQGEILQDVKMCEYEMINKLNSYLKTSNSTGNISSESIDGYSASYITVDRISDVLKSKKNDLDDTVQTYLMGIVYNGEHLLYVGVK